MDRGGLSVGRPAKPSAVKALAGTDRADRRNDNEPEFCLLENLEPPPHLDAASADVWRQVAPVLRRGGVLTAADVIALEMLCDSVADYRAARREREGKFTQPTPKGGQQLDQLLIAQQMASKRAEAFMSKFGMDPAARSRVMVDPQMGLFEQPAASGPDTSRFFQH
jgi:P27 family predicted phage terminase small subunit